MEIQLSAKLVFKNAYSALHIQFVQIVIILLIIGYFMLMIVFATQDIFKAIVQLLVKHAITLVKIALVLLNMSVQAVQQTEIIIQHQASVLAQLVFLSLMLLATFVTLHVMNVRAYRLIVLIAYFPNS